MLSTSSLRWLRNARGIRLGRWTTGDACGSKYMVHLRGNSQIPLKRSANSSKTGTSIYVSVTDSTSLMGPKLMHPFRPVMGYICVDYINVFNHLSVSVLAFQVTFYHQGFTTIAKWDEMLFAECTEYSILHTCTGGMKLAEDPVSTLNLISSCFGPILMFSNAFSV